jgi:hypothetical protein
MMKMSDDFPRPGLGRRKTPEEMIAPRNDDCMECARHYPGVGCNSEAEMACGCCFSQITPSERIAQLTRILVSVCEMLKYVEQAVKDKDTENDENE